jgi:spore coat polysaccharide biosynthesis protein SpsF
MNYLFLIQARLNSTRLPKKVLLDLLPGEPLIDIIIGRLQRVRNSAGSICVLTTDTPNDDALAEHLQKRGMRCFRGDEQNVFERFHEYLKHAPEPCDYFFRICADNPLIEPAFIEQMIDCVESENGNFDYVSFKSSDGVPVIQNKFGLFCEMVKTETFLNVAPESLTAYQQEHVTPLFYTDKKFSVRLLEIPREIETNELRCTVDTAEDAEAVKKIFLRHGRDVPYSTLLSRTR